MGRKVFRKLNSLKAIDMSSVLGELQAVMRSGLIALVALPADRIVPVTKVGKSWCD